MRQGHAGKAGLLFPPGPGADLLLRRIAQRLGNSQALPRAQTAGQEATRRLWEAPVARERPLPPRRLCLAARTRGVAPESWAVRCRWVARSVSLSVRALGMGPRPGPRSRCLSVRAPLDCFASLRPTPAPLLSPCTHWGVRWQKHTVKKSASSRSGVPRLLVLGFRTHPQRLSGVRGGTLTIESDSVRQALGSRAEAARRAVLPLGPWQVSTHFMVSKLWLLYSLCVFS